MQYSMQEHTPADAVADCEAVGLPEAAREDAGRARQSQIWDTVCLRTSACGVQMLSVWQQACMYINKTCCLVLETHFPHAPESKPHHVMLLSGT
jgi:hypothetical protein